MPPRLLIIADDLTGANDTGVQFARRGIATLVSISHQIPLTKFSENCQVLVVNTESRHLAPDDAYVRVFDLAVQGVALGIPHFYKKTDSTLRGNIGSELAALLAATKENELFFAPAYPKLNRTTERGYQLVAGTPIHQTDFASDPLNPMREAFVPAVIAAQTNLAVQIFDETRKNSAPIIFVMNAASNEELRVQAQWLKAKKRTKLLAGSAGWAAFLPEIISFDSSPIPAPKISAPMLIVNGSLHENSLRQVACAAQQGIPVIDFQMDDAARLVSKKIAEQGSAILTTKAEIDCGQAAENLAHITCQILAHSCINTLIVFGGDTLAAIAQQRNWQVFRPRTEFFSGVPIVEICEQEKLLLVTKAGGFGAEDLLVRVSEARP